MYTNMYHLCSWCIERLVLAYRHMGFATCSQSQIISLEPTSNCCLALFASLIC